MSTTAASSAKGYGKKKGNGGLSEIDYLQKKLGKAMTANPDALDGFTLPEICSEPKTIE